MKITKTWHLFAPNVWAPVEVCAATVHLDAADAETPVGSLLATVDESLPERAELFPAPIAPEPPGPAGLVELLGQVALTLQAIARGPAGRFLLARAAADDAGSTLVIEARDPVLVVDCLEAAAAMLETLRVGGRPAAAAIRDQLVDRADDVCLGPSTMLIVDAAAARGIPWRRLGDLSLVQFGHGRRQRRIWTAETDQTPAIAEAISRDKQLTRQLLAAAGVPVPRGMLVESAAEAWRAAEAVSLPVVVKPLHGNHGRGVFLELTDRAGVEQAYAEAVAESRPGAAVVVEEHIPGIEHRLLVVGERMVACARGEHLHVSGDGRRTITALINAQLNNDPRRGRTETLPNKTIETDPGVRAELARQGLGPDSIPAAGRRVLVKRIGSHGPDVTDLVHPEIARIAVRAARTLGLDVAGIDLVATDVALPPVPQAARICEVNAGPQLLIHAQPSAGPPRPVGAEIVATLFAAGETGRIPVVALLGCRDADLPAMLAGRLEDAGLTAAVTGPAGKWIAGQRCSTADHATPAAARDALVAPDIDLLVCALDWQSIAAAGLPVDLIDLLVLGSLPERTAAAAGATVDDVVRLLVAAVPASGMIVCDAAPAWAADHARRGLADVVDAAALPGAGDLAARLTAVVMPRPDAPRRADAILR
jgi:cyanophycin synthetase